MPFGSSYGKNIMKFPAFCISAQMFYTDSSSKKGTEIILTCLNSNNFFSSARISFRKSFVSMVLGGTYSCTNMKVRLVFVVLTAILEVLDEVVDAAQLVGKL